MEIKVEKKVEVPDGEFCCTLQDSGSLNETCCQFF